MYKLTLDGIVVYIQAHLVPIICGPITNQPIELLRIHSLICMVCLWQIPQLGQTPNQ